MNEESRLQAVKQFVKLNLRSDLELKKTIALAAKICRTPISSITIIDKDTQWLKVNKGLDIEQTPRNISFCTHTIKRKNLFLVNDARADARFQNSPLVTSGPKIRFYAGYPLITHDGHRLGALWIISRTSFNRSKADFNGISQTCSGINGIKLSLEQYHKVLDDFKCCETQIKERF